MTSDPPRGLQAGATPGGVWRCLFKVRQPEAFGMEAEGFGGASSKEGVLGLHLQPAAGAHNSKQQQQAAPQRAVRACRVCTSEQQQPTPGEGCEGVRQLLGAQ